MHSFTVDIVVAKWANLDTRVFFHHLNLMACSNDCLRVVGKYANYLCPCQRLTNEVRGNERSVHKVRAAGLDFDVLCFSFSGLRYS